MQRAPVGLDEHLSGADSADADADSRLSADSNFEPLPRTDSPNLKPNLGHIQGLKQAQHRRQSPSENQMQATPMQQQTHIGQSVSPAPQSGAAKAKSVDFQQMHVCRICDKLLSSSSSLDRHMLTHSGERPFVCKRCQMTFTTNGNMHRHMRTHLHKDSLARQAQEQLEQLEQQQQLRQTNKQASSLAATDATSTLADSAAKTLTPAKANSGASVSATASPAAQAAALLNQQLAAALANSADLSASASLVGASHSPTAGANISQLKLQLNLSNSKQNISADGQQTDPKALMLAGFQGDQLGLESVKAVMLAAAAAAAAAAVSQQQQQQHQHQHQHHHHHHHQQQPFELLSQQQPQQMSTDADQTGDSLAQRLRGKRRKQVNPSRAPHQLASASVNSADDSANDDDPELDTELEGDAADNCRASGGFESADEQLRGDNERTSRSEPLQAEPEIKRDSVDDFDSNNNHTEEQDDHNNNNNDDNNNNNNTGSVQGSQLGDDPVEQTDEMDKLMKAEKTSRSLDGSDSDAFDDASMSLDAPNSLSGLSSQPGSENPFRLDHPSDEQPRMGQYEQQQQLDHHHLQQQQQQRQSQTLTSLPTPLTTVNGEIIEDISQSYVKTANPNAARKGGKRNRHCYKCKLCTYSSVDRCTLVRHLRIHSGERPYICGICRYAFTTKANCERHVRKRHKKQYNSLGGAGGVKGSNGGGRSLIITDHTNHQTIPVKVNPVAAQTISQTLQRIQEKQQSSAGGDRMTDEQEADDCDEHDDQNSVGLNEHQLMSDLDERSSDRLPMSSRQQQQQQQQQRFILRNNPAGEQLRPSSERTNKQASSLGAQTTATCLGGSIKGANKRRLRQDHLADQSGAYHPYQRRCLLDTLAGQSADADQPLFAGQTVQSPLRNLKDARQTPTSMSNLMFNCQRGLNQTASAAAASSFAGSPVMGPANAELLANLIGQLQQASQPSTNTASKSPSISQLQLLHHHQQQQQQQHHHHQQQQPQQTSPVANQLDQLPMSDANFLANMLAAGKSLADNGQLSESTSSILLSPKHLSQQFAQLGGLQNSPASLFLRRNPFNAIDMATQALDLSCKFQSSK